MYSSFDFFGVIACSLNVQDNCMKALLFVCGGEIFPGCIMVQVWYS